ncbi:hypothetical protein HOLleu_37955 [Holothuria leucospilota]|uniref:Phosphatidylinositol 3,4,5-trisphosphate 3-phosphatase and dual-specificity protein phosphatase PTEN n=1 Tax=Holothuria leucospilota TaxID=206669 RepID=A0A9Q1BF49_HOLLE|nr:hypothetical protein HOLleu_37955 [Holothuria leucospilota]
MAAKIRELVSKNKNRYTAGDYDLDLTYISHRIIAMGFPAERLESMYRNDMESVVRFLDEHHKDHYKVYNLCSERNYDGSKFYNRVACYPFDDHNPPRMEIIRPFCEDVDSWLKKDEKNVAAIHCKAGKGRTGVMICALLLHQKTCETSSDAMEYYGEMRTKDGKGVTIPSQRRYVQYYGALLRHNLTYTSQTILLQRVQLETIPMMSNGTCNPFFVIYQHKFKIFTSEITKGIKRWQRKVDYELNQPVCGDIKIEFFHKTTMLKMDKKPMFHFWFNTFFVVNPHCLEDQYDHHVIYHNGSTTLNTSNSAEHSPNSSSHEPGDIMEMVLEKDEIDKANKDKTNKVFSPNLKVTLTFSRGAEEDQAQCSGNDAGISPCNSDNDLLDGEESTESDIDNSEWESAQSTCV